VELSGAGDGSLVPAAAEVAAEVGGTCSGGVAKKGARAESGSGGCGGCARAGCRVSMPGADEGRAQDAAAVAAAGSCPRVQAAMAQAAGVDSGGGRSDPDVGQEAATARHCCQDDRAERCGGLGGAGASGEGEGAAGDGGCATVVVIVVTAAVAAERLVRAGGGQRSREVSPAASGRPSERRHGDRLTGGGT